MLLPIGREIGAARSARGCAETSMRETQSGELGARDKFVGYHVGGAQRGDFRFEPGSPQAGKFRDGLDVDVERVEKQSAVRRVGTGLLGAIGKQRMQWIQADGGRTPRGGKRNQM